MVLSHRVLSPERMAEGTLLPKGGLRSLLLFRSSAQVGHGDLRETLADQRGAEGHFTSISSCAADPDPSERCQNLDTQDFTCTEYVQTGEQPSSERSRPWICRGYELQVRPWK